MHYSCISKMQLTLMAGSSGMLGDETQERRVNSDLMREAGSAALRRLALVYHDEVATLIRLRLSWLGEAGGVQKGA
jgi:hypothetical protein